MKQRLAFLVLLCLLLGGCSWMRGSYSSVTPHEEHSQTGLDEVITAKDYIQLRQALEELIQAGRTSAIIYVPDFDPNQVGTSMDMAIRYVRNTFPVGAYAVEEIRYELGASSGRPAVAVEISYAHSYVEIQKIRRVPDMDSAKEIVYQVLDSHNGGVVLWVDSYASMDIAQLTESYGAEHPDRLMEIPQVVVGLYPENGVSRIVEIQFTYQNSRDTLRQMQQQTQQLFTSAEMYVSPDASDHLVLTQLYTFLVERFDYKVDTSITPAYSLLRHGVGDSKAFATVYAAMCRNAGLECFVVTGTRAGEPWCWNIVRDNGLYFHVDLLRCNASGGFAELLDGDMAGYVWDYSGYPPCDKRALPQESATEPQEEPENSADSDQDFLN